MGTEADSIKTKRPIFGLKLFGMVLMSKNVKIVFLDTQVSLEPTPVK